MREGCVFCKIVDKKIKSKTVRESENLIVINDTSPQAPVHLLIIPKLHIADISGATDSLWVEIKKMVLELVKERGINNFRLITNAGDAAYVKHMHVHLLGGVTEDRKL